MKKTLKLIDILTLVLTLCFDLTSFIYLVFSSATIASTEGLVGAIVFSVVVAWFAFAAAIVFSVLVFRRHLKGGTERDLKILIFFSLALFVVGIFVPLGATTLMFVMFALFFVEYMLREKHDDSSADKTSSFEQSDAAEPDADRMPEAVPMPEAMHEAPRQDAVQHAQAPKRKVITPLRRGDEALHTDDSPRDKDDSEI